MKLYVGNLSILVDDAQLSALAEPFGAPVSAIVAIDRMSGISRGFGFVEFGTFNEARSAIVGLDGRLVNGQAITVKEARARNPWAVASH